MDQLYFIAIVPPAEIREAVKALKEEMWDRFGAKHALKSPAHITLQMPFKWAEVEEKRLLLALRGFAIDQWSFPVQLSGFDCFAPRVIYLRVREHKPLVQLHERLQTFLTKDLLFSPDMTQARFHPHLTIATRDLRKPAFREAWPEYADRSFSAQFVADSLFLLKHNGRSWDIYRELPFAGRTQPPV